MPRIINFDNCIISHTASTVGDREKNGPLGKFFDNYESDAYFGEDSWEKAETEMVFRCLSLLQSRSGLRDSEIDLLAGGDLLNQCTASSFCAGRFNIPYLGLYGACSTCASALISVCLLCSYRYARGIAFSSSHFCSSERQFRFPLEYGSLQTPAAQTTVTAAGAFLIDSKAPVKQGDIIISNGIYGKVIDSGITDGSDMGAAMAPAAADTICEYIKEIKSFKGYDCIVTGDLGSKGRELLVELLDRRNADIRIPIYDCGELIFSKEDKSIKSGGSGAGCFASVLSSYFLPKFKNGMKKALFLATGALLSQKTLLQKESIRSVAHGICIERI